MKRVIFAAALAAITLVATSQSSRAGQPETIRYFGDLILSDEPCVTWESEASKRIVSHRPNSVNDTLPFITPDGTVWTDDDAVVRDDDGNIVLDLRSTVWKRMPVVHVMSTGAEHIEHVYWLVEDVDGDGIADEPEPGMTAACGPDGEVVDLVEIRIAQAASSDSYNPNRFYISPQGTRFCIAIGTFRK